MDYGVEIGPSEVMGYDPTTHQKHYGAWIDNDDNALPWPVAVGSILHKSTRGYN